MTHITHPIYLHPRGIETEYPATFQVDLRHYQAEPYSHGGGRGTETEADATLVSWEGGGRAEAVALDGEHHVRDQEMYVAEVALWRDL